MLYGLISTLNTSEIIDSIGWIKERLYIIYSNKLKGKKEELINAKISQHDKEIIKGFTFWNLISNSFGQLKNTENR